LGGVAGGADVAGGAGAIAAARAALEARADHPSELVREHVAWALAQLARRVPTARSENGERAAGPRTNG
jgi:epoxyqueuosine reductase